MMFFVAGTQNENYEDQREFKGTPGYRNKLILFDSQWLVKTDGATFIFRGKLGHKFLPGQFWPCLSFSALRHGRKSWFLILWTKAQASLLLWYEIVWWWGRGIRFEWVSSAVITVEDHALDFKNNQLKLRYCSNQNFNCVLAVIDA